MAIFDTSMDPVGGMSAIMASSGAVARRFCRWSGTNGAVAYPSSGGDVDGVACGSVSSGRGDIYLAHPGLPFQVEAGGSFSAGASLQTDNSGRAIQRTTGVIVARALETGTIGSVIWAVFSSGR